MHLQMHLHQVFLKGSHVHAKQSRLVEVQSLNHPLEQQVERRTDELRHTAPAGSRPSATQRTICSAVIFIASRIFAPNRE
jgi:hypothetical protein